MKDDQGPFSAFLNAIPSAGEDHERLTISDIQEYFARRSFGPFLLIAALPVMTPLVNIPGVASIMGIVIFLTSVQILAGRRTIWLPSVIRRRSVRRSHVRKALEFMRPAARWIDKLIRRRLDALTQPPFLYVIATICAVLGFLMPFVELIPATSAIPAIPIAAFGLGIAMHDGAFIIFGMVALAVMLGIAIAIGFAII